MTDMSNEKLAVVATLEEIHKIGQQTDELRTQAREKLDSIRQFLIGRRVRRYGHTFQIVQVNIGLISNEITVDGVRVSKTGKVGTRQFDVGLLRLCEPVS